MTPEVLELLNIVAERIRSGVPLPDEIKIALSKLLDRLAEQGPTDAVQQTPEEPGDLQSAPHPSSNINAFRYDPQNKRLFVKFHGSDVKDGGPVYSYEGVPQYIFDVFSRGAVAAKTNGRNKYGKWWIGKTPSLGASMYALIKQAKFPYKRLS